MNKTPTSEKILKVAEECFSRYGFDATSTRQIARESGVNMSMLQYYFGCKEKLLETLLDSQSQLIRSQLEPLLTMEGSAILRLEQMQHIIVEHAWNHNRLYRIVMQELLLQQRETITGVAHQSYTYTFRIMKEVIEDGIRRGEFREDVDAELIISMLKGTLFFILNLQSTFCPADTQPPPSKERVHEFFSNILERYLLKN